MQGRIPVLVTDLHWLTAYTSLLLRVTELLETGPLVYSRQIRSFLLQAYTFPTLDRWENGWRELRALLGDIDRC